jgi:propionyl-CoA carboxylase beta chain
MAVIERVFDHIGLLRSSRAVRARRHVGFARLNGEVVGSSRGSRSAGRRDRHRPLDKMALSLRAFNIRCYVRRFARFLRLDQNTASSVARDHYAYSEAAMPRSPMMHARRMARTSYEQQAHHRSSFSWPTAGIAVMGAEGAVSILYGKD